jgi:hypothetical protein
MAKILEVSFHRADKSNIELRMEAGNFHIARFIYEHKDLQESKLTNGHDHIYKVTEVCDNMVRLLNIYNESGRLGTPTYNVIIEAYKPFLKNYMSFEALARRIKMANNEEGWLDA